MRTVPGRLILAGVILLALLALTLGTLRARRPIPQGVLPATPGIPGSRIPGPSAAEEGHPEFEMSAPPPSPPPQARPTARATPRPHPPREARPVDPHATSAGKESRPPDAERKEPRPTPRPSAPGSEPGATADSGPGTTASDRTLPQRESAGPALSPAGSPADAPPAPAPGDTTAAAAPRGLPGPRESPVLTPPVPVDMPALHPVLRVTILPAPDGQTAAGETSARGRVRVRLLVRADGSVAQAEVLVSSGDPDLDHAARQGLLRWRFAPARRDGVPIDAYLLLWVTFG